MEPKDWFVKIAENAWINVMQITRLRKTEDCVILNINDEPGTTRVVGSFARDLLTRTGTS